MLSFHSRHSRQQVWSQTCKLIRLAPVGFSSLVLCSLHTRLSRHMGFLSPTLNSCSRAVVRGATRGGGWTKPRQRQLSQVGPLTSTPPTKVIYSCYFCCSRFMSLPNIGSWHQPNWRRVMLGIAISLWVSSHAHITSLACMYSMN